MKDKIECRLLVIFGSKVIYCSDEFFADSGRMLQASEPVMDRGQIR